MSTWFEGDGVAVGIAQRNGNMKTNFPICCKGITSNGASSEFLTPFYLDPDNTNILYYAGENRLYKTGNAINITQSIWDNLAALPINQKIQSFATTREAYDSASSYLLIGGESGRIFKLDNPLSPQI